MRITKVDGTRIAVVSKKLQSGRAVLYKVASYPNGNNGDVESIVKRRVDSANVLYSVFFKASKEKSLPNNLEQAFTILMSSMEVKWYGKIRAAYKSGDKKEITKCIESQVGWLIGLKRIEKEKWDYKAKQNVVVKTIEFSDLASGILDSEKLEDALLRMRKPLKRGTNKAIAKRLIKALASGDREIFANAVTDMRDTDSARLYRFIDAVNKDYYKTNVLKSLAHHDVKVQVSDAEKLDLASVYNDKGNKKALTDILEKYASSKDGAAETLLAMKRVMFAYLFGFSDENYGGFFEEENLWKFPSEEVGNDPVFDGFFDEGFEPLPQYADKEKEWEGASIEELGREDKINFGKLKARVRFVNFGKYLCIISETEDETVKFWANYIKEYIDKNYIEKKEIDIKKLKRIPMCKECYKEAVRYLCGKYIDLGKAVYHFTMPLTMSAKAAGGMTCGVLRPEYRNGISSFSYEAIKAEETLQRNIADATVSALSAFSRAVLDAEKQQAGEEDILFLKDDRLEALKRTNAGKYILRYYGGFSAVKAFDLDTDALIAEIKSHFDLIRNENFHYTAGKVKNIGSVNTLKLWENDVKVYADVVRQKYYSNNAAMFYKQADVAKLVAALYAVKQVNESQIPAFRNIFKRTEVPAFIRGMEKNGSYPWMKDTAVRTKYEGALYFLLKEIYYNDFVHSESKALELLVKAVNDYKGSKDVANSDKASQSFKTYVNALAAQNLSFAKVCQMINQEISQQNTKSSKEEKIGDKESYAHFRMLLPLCLKRAFEAYLCEKYGFLYKPVYDENLKGEPEYLDHVAINCGVAINGKVDTDDEKRRLAWFTFAHFVHPRQLNFLIGDFKSFIQYREAVLKRAEAAKQYVSDEDKKREHAIVDDRVKRAKEILSVLEFVRPIAGRVSNVFEDYYESPEEYAKYLGNYIEFAKEGEPTFKKLVEFCKNTLPDGAMIDIYADEKNPKVLRNVEVARMYAGGDVLLYGIEKVDAKMICKYYAQKDTVAKILSKGLCESEEEQRKVVKQQRLKGQITLNDVTETFSLVNDMLGQLVSMAYLRERDKMYLLLGYYYMALRNADNWQDEILDTLEVGNIRVDGGLVLYQIVAMFDYGTPFLYFSEGEDGKDGKWVETKGMSIGLKEARVERMHAASLACAMQLFENKDYSREISILRNYVDHFKYYTDHAKSITDLYGEYFTKFFGYSTKLRKSVLVNFSNVLEKYFLTNGVSFMRSDAEVKMNLIATLTSQKFTYKLSKKAEKKTCEGTAKSANFVKNVKQVLIYKAD